jgi:hypothetical protein
LLCCPCQGPGSARLALSSGLRRRRRSRKAYGPARHRRQRPGGRRASGAAARAATCGRKLARSVVS